MRLSSRLLPLVLLLSVGVTTAVAQPSPSGQNLTALQQSSSHSEATPSSIVLKGNEASARKSVGVDTEALNRFAESNPLESHNSAVRPVSFDGSGVPIRPAPQSEADDNSRTILYIVGGVLVVGGAVAGILALSSGPEPIPAPPGRP